MDSASASAAVNGALATNVGALLHTMQPWKVGDKLWTSAELLPFLVVDPGNIDVAIAFNTSWVAFWGAETARAKKAFDLKQADYRIARDRWAKDRRQQNKVTKEVLEEEWRATADYRRWWEEQAEAERAWSSSSFIYEAFTRQTTNLTSLTKFYADERASRADRR